MPIDNSYRRIMEDIQWEQMEAMRRLEMRPAEMRNWVRVPGGVIPVEPGPVEEEERFAIETGREWPRGINVPSTETPASPSQDDGYLRVPNPEYRARYDAELAGRRPWWDQVSPTPRPNAPETEEQIRQKIEDEFYQKLVGPK